MAEKKVFTAYYTKFWIDGGVLRLEFEEGARPGYARHTGTGPYIYGRVGRDIYMNRAEAVADAEKRRARRIASLQKQIDRLKEMTIKVKETP